MTAILNQLKEGKVVEAYRIELTPAEAEATRKEGGWPDILQVHGSFWSLEDWDGQSEAFYMWTWGLTLERPAP